MEKLFLVVISISLGLNLMPLAVGSSGERSALQAAVAQPPAGETEKRRVEGNVIISENFPAIRIKVSKAFKYAGRLQFNLKEMARVDRFVFVDADRGHVRRLFMVQFEGFLDGVNHTYNYRMRNPMTLGGQTYSQNCWFFDNARNIKENPGAESDKTTAFLKEKHYSVDDELMMSRFVRVVDEEKRHEIIIYYIENLKDSGFPFTEYNGDGQPSARQTAVEKALTERSLKSFTLLE
jgi:hypothetical protein